MFPYSSGLLEEINHKTKMMEHNGRGSRRFDLFQAKILLNIQY
ncbi:MULTISPECIES: hypothetical protein [unclassified Sporosarcina]